jgi:hypothetical protein
VTTVTGIGTLCIDSARFVAVTTTWERSVALSGEDRSLFGLCALSLDVPCMALLVADAFCANTGVAMPVKLLLQASIIRYEVRTVSPLKTVSKDCVSVQARSTLGLFLQTGKSVF